MDDVTSDPMKRIYSKNKTFPQLHLINYSTGIPHCRSSLGEAELPEHSERSLLQEREGLGFPTLRIIEVNPSHARTLGLPPELGPGDKPEESLPRWEMRITLAAGMPS